MTQPHFRQAIIEYIRAEAKPADKFSHQARLFALACQLAGKKPFDEVNLTQIRLVNQMQILESVGSRIGTVLSDVRGALLSELEDASVVKVYKKRE